jgi:hypothetical protein
LKELIPRTPHSSGGAVPNDGVVLLRAHDHESQQGFLTKGTASFALHL